MPAIKLEEDAAAMEIKKEKPVLLEDDDAMKANTLEPAIKLEEEAAEEIKQEMPEDDTTMMATMLEPAIKLEEATAEEIKQDKDDSVMANKLEPEITKLEAEVEIKKEVEEDMEQDSLLSCKTKRYPVPTYGGNTQTLPWGCGLGWVLILELGQKYPYEVGFLPVPSKSNETKKDAEFYRRFQKYKHALVTKRT
jgi:hypothetical protein